MSTKIWGRGIHQGETFQTLGLTGLEGLKGLASREVAVHEADAKFKTASQQLRA